MHCSATYGLSGRMPNLTKGDLGGRGRNTRPLTTELSSGEDVVKFGLLRSLLPDGAGSLALHLHRSSVITQRNEPAMPQVAIESPVHVFELSHELRLQPVTFRHL